MQRDMDLSSNFITRDSARRVRICSYSHLLRPRAAPLLGPRLELGRLHEHRNVTHIIETCDPLSKPQHPQSRLKRMATLCASTPCILSVDIGRTERRSKVEDRHPLENSGASTCTLVLLSGTSTCTTLNAVTRLATRLESTRCILSVDTGDRQKELGARKTRHARCQPSFELTYVGHAVVVRTCLGLL